MSAITLQLESPLQIARKLTAWHMLDLNLVYKQGFMRVGGTMPRGKTGELIAWGLLRFDRDTANGHILKPTNLFLRVRRLALIRMAHQGTAA